MLPAFSLKPNQVAAVVGAGMLWMVSHASLPNFPMLLPAAD
jgi:hypothetical protein